ncbi:hypothetical protein LAZ67_X001711 [Cordylochernes scorpioides]|uniref:Uncharacterized protein n=1 Tax=Cordylochernes scorpioides TaxID=51811 RepID=A0ABY6LWT4_9ARAC|nr:hypothetical protein LAZ67_X001711 [Cordylochernes scorpioides]
MKALVDKAHFIRIDSNLFNEFKFGKSNLEYEPRSGRPPTAVTQKQLSCCVALHHDCTVGVTSRFASGNTGPRGPKISQTPPSEESTELWTPRYKQASRPLSVQKDGTGK